LFEALAIYEIWEPCDLAISPIERLDLEQSQLTRMEKQEILWKNANCDASTNLLFKIATV
jgi:hypothetical protein